MTDITGKNASIILRAVAVLRSDNRFGPRLSKCWLPLNGAWKERALQAGSNVLAIPSTRARHNNSMGTIAGGSTRPTTTEILENDGGHFGKQ